MYDKTMLRTQVHEDLAEKFRQARFIDTEDLNGRAGRIGQWAQNIEHGADAHVLAGTRTMSHRPMVERRKKKPDSYLIDAVGHAIGG